MLSGAMIPLAIVETASPPKINAPALSITTAMAMAPPSGDPIPRILKIGKARQTQI